MSRVGLLFLDDLAMRGPWLGDRGGTWLERRGRTQGRPLPLVTAPPPVLVVVVDRGDRLVHSAPWLRTAGGLLLIFTQVDADAEPVVVEERAKLVAGLGNVVDVWLPAPEAVDDAIDDALAMGSEVAAGVWTPIRPGLVVEDAVRPGSWRAWEPMGQGARDLDGDEVLGELARSICRPAAGVWALELSTGGMLDLTTGVSVDAPGLGDSVGNVAAMPDGRGWLGSGWAVQGASPTPPMPGGDGRPLGVDPAVRALWGGRSCVFHWRVMTTDGAAFWASSSHDFPGGHGKKLYLYKDNEPLWVHLAPDASACLSVYEHDVLLAPGLPVRWHDVNGVALLRRAQEPRAVFFQRADGGEGYPAEPAFGEEDARDRRATVTLGPSAALRYVVGFDEATWRFVGEDGVRIGGPGEGWAAYSEGHDLVRRGEGRLLAGWHRWIVTREGDTLWRTDLESGARTALGGVDRPITEAVAVVGTPNVVLLQVEGRSARLRLV